VAGEHQLGDEDLAGALQHPLLAGREALLAVADGEVADDLGHLEDVAGLEALDVALEPAAPIALGRGLTGAQDLEDAVDVVGAADLADADLLAVVARHHEGEVAICQLEDQVLPGLAAYLTILEALDDRGPMLWVDDAVADLEHTRKPLPSNGTLNRITFPEGCVQTKSQVDGLFDVGAITRRHRAGRRRRGA
jgi:hypothetical protein